MGFRLVPKSVTLNDLERRNGRIVCVISPNSVALGPYYVKVEVVEDTGIQSAYLLPSCLEFTSYKWLICC